MFNPIGQISVSIICLPSIYHRITIEFDSERERDTAEKELRQNTLLIQQIIDFVGQNTAGLIMVYVPNIW